MKEVFFRKAIAALTLAISAAGIVLGFLSLHLNTLEAYPVPLLGFLTFSLLGLLVHVHRLSGVWERRLIILAGFSLISALLLLALPEFLFGFEINAIIRRSLISALLLFAVALPAASFSLSHLLGATPRAEDISRYPLIIFPIFLALAAYAVLVSHILIEGAPFLDWRAITDPYPYGGMRNHILGTFLLMALTSLISLPIGVGAGVFLAEHEGRLAGVVRFSLAALRGISVFILGITALKLVAYGRGTFLSDVFTGGVYQVGEGQTTGDGSFLIAAIFLSLLVVPLIARATEEGIHSLPPDIREGSLALGVSEERTLTRIILPWALPNIVSGFLMGCAEAAGSVVVIMFMAGRGEGGIGPLREVTSLAYFIEDYRLLSPAEKMDMGGMGINAPALLLLMMTTVLGIAALILKQRLARRYRGA